MRRVILESPFASPYAHEAAIFAAYARRALRDSLDRGEAPFASHVLYTLVLNDDDRAERNQGIMAGFAWGRVAEATIVYADYGISPGMELGIERARESGRLCSREVSITA